MPTRPPLLRQVSDFGLARPPLLRAGSTPGGVLDGSQLSRSLPWTAPEVVRTPHAVTEKADVFSFGLILCE
jgi:hypothetical protein